MLLILKMSCKSLKTSFYVQNQIKSTKKMYLRTLLFTVPVKTLDTPTHRTV